MIDLEVQNYCENCPDFEADVIKTNLWCNDKIVRKTIVCCENRYRCESLVDHLKNEASKQSLD